MGSLLLSWDDPPAPSPQTSHQGAQRLQLQGLGAGGVWSRWPMPCPAHQRDGSEAVATSSRNAARHWGQSQRALHPGEPHLSGNLGYPRRAGGYLPYNTQVPTVWRGTIAAEVRASPPARYARRGAGAAGSPTSPPQRRAGAEPSTPPPDRHKASLHTDPAAEPSCPPRHNSGKKHLAL